MTENIKGLRDSARSLALRRQPGIAGGTSRFVAPARRQGRRDWLWRALGGRTSGLWKAGGRRLCQGLWLQKTFKRGKIEFSICL